MSNEEVETEPANEELTKRIASLFEPLPNPVVHGDFNRRMFLESMIVQAGMGISITSEDIIEHGGITEKEFVVIKDEYVAAGIILEEKNMYDVVMYKLNTTVKNKIEEKGAEAHKEAMKEAAAALKSAT